MHRPLTKISVLYFAALGFSYCVAGELHPSCLRSTGAGTFTCSTPGNSQEPLVEKYNHFQFLGIYSFYRFMSQGSEHRRCRLHPTCSLFAARAISRYGLFRGGLMGLARAQMEHSDQGGYLRRDLGRDGYFLYPESFNNWEHLDLK